MHAHWRPAILLYVLLTLLTGFLYPCFITASGKLLFHDQAMGSLLGEQGRVVGSSLIGQNFESPKYFWGRPSATSPQPYNALASSGSNLGPLNPALTDAVKSRIDALRQSGVTISPLPSDLVLASASGLDPDISPEAAHAQVARVAKARGLPPERVDRLVTAETKGRDWGVFGAPRVNVLLLNRALDRLHG